MIGPLTTTALIFGGCCVNVFALEAIVKYAPLDERYNDNITTSLISCPDSKPAAVSHKYLEANIKDIAHAALKSRPDHHILAIRVCHTKLVPIPI